MKYFDSHAHYYDARFYGEECPEGAEALLRELFATTLDAVVNVGTCPETSRLAIAQARKFDSMYTAVGIHPTDGQSLPDAEAALRETEELLRDPMSRAVVLGEIGLDYHYPDTDRKKQKELFDAQLSMSVRLGLPIAVHDRDAHGDVMDMLRAHPQAYGVLHSFSGSPEMAEELVRMGYYISFSGTLTFKNARRTVECAQCVPRERILIETDAPYLCPHPHRGELNHSGRLSYTCARLAELLGIREEEAAALTADNARRLFRL